MFQEKLCQIGFTDNEARIYLELLSIGPQAVSVIANRVNLNRTTAYSVLKGLEKKGVVSFYNNGKVKYFTANDPNSLVGYVDRKCRTFDYYRNELLTIIPKFRSLIGDYDFKKPVVSYFEGMEGVKHVMYDALNAKGDFCTFLPLHKWLNAGMEKFLIQYKDFRIISKKVKLRAIVPDTEKVRAFFDKHNRSSEMTDILYVSNGSLKKFFENQINIYNDRVAIIHLDKGEEYGVIMESEPVANMQRGIFEMAWLGCSKIK